jgi:uncharacterized RDD family membrane protein YckC
MTLGQGEPFAEDDELFSGVLLKRVIAYMLDIVFLAVLSLPVWGAVAVLSILSLGLLWPVLVPLATLLPFAYHTVTLGGPRSATWGMRILDLELRTLEGDRPSYLQALAQTVLFYVSVMLTGSLILLVALVTERHRTLHDLLAGTVMINRTPV